MSTTIDLEDRTFIHIDRRENGYYYCVSGQNADGLEFESDDEGPFETADAAEIAARVYLIEYHEPGR